MYAVIESGGKQYRVELGSEIQVDRMDAQPGNTIRLERVLLVADGDEAAIGTPLVDGAVVRADVLRQDRGEKLVVFKYKPKARRRVKKGHRADLTVLRIADIALGGRSAAEEAKAAEAGARRERERAEKEAAAQAKRDAGLAAQLAEAEAEAAAAAKAATEERVKPSPTRSRSRRSATTAATAAASMDAVEPAASTDTVEPITPTDNPSDPDTKDE